MRKILLVDDHSLILGGIKDWVGDSFRVDFASTTSEAMKMLSDQVYYATILDVSLGENKGFDLIRVIPGNTLVFFLSMHKTAVYIQMAIDFQANGYFLKDESPELLIKALNRPLDRAFWMSESVENELKNLRPQKGSNYEKLTPREQQIFSMLAEDLNYKEIANRLNLSTKTINNHRDHLMKKLELDTQTGLVHEAVRLGIITVE